MPDVSDMDLVGRFVRDHSEAAFAELVERHVNLVYSVALRFTGHEADARDVAQAVFIILARKAPGLSSRTVISGWLYETTRFTASRWRRANSRRQAREQKAYMESALNDSRASESAADIWQQLAPTLETAMSSLGARDRALLALRFYENKTGPEAAALLGIEIATAHKRTARALEKLRRFFARRGLALTAAAIAGAITANSVQAAPAGLAGSISVVAAAKGAAAGTSTLTLVKGALKIMAWTKAKTIVAVGLGVLLTASTAKVVVTGSLFGGVDESLWGMDVKNLKRAPRHALIIRPTRFHDSGALSNTDGPIILRNVDFEDLLQMAFRFRDEKGFLCPFSRERIILPPHSPKGHYDLMFTYPAEEQSVLQKAVSKKFGCSLTKNNVPTNSFLLKVSDPNALVGHISKPQGKTDYDMTDNSRTWQGFPLSSVTQFLERRLHKPVTAAPELTTAFYDLSFRWQNSQSFPDDIRRDLAAAGLQLIATNQPIETLVVKMK